MDLKADAIVLASGGDTNNLLHSDISEDKIEIHAVGDCVLKEKTEE